jgi:hypothetical protein
MTIPVVVVMNIGEYRKEDVTFHFGTRFGEAIEFHAHPLTKLGFKLQRLVEGFRNECYISTRVQAQVRKIF